MKGLLRPAFVCLALSSFTPIGTLARDLTFEERVKAQEAIERVYYSYQLGTTQPFEQAVPRNLLERKVRTYLEQSQALEKFWNTPITAEALSREVQRMTGATRMPQRLKELFSALGNDPVRIGECLARPVLAERLLERFYAKDQRFHASKRAEMENLRLELLHGDLDPRADSPRHELVELTVEEQADSTLGPESDPKGSAAAGAPRHRAVSPQEFQEMRSSLESAERHTGDLREEPDRFVVHVLLEADANRLLVAEFSVPKVPLEGWWHEIEKTLPGIDSTMAVRNSKQAEARGLPIVQDLADMQITTDQFFSCLPDYTWVGKDLTGIPSARQGHTMVWTGSVAIIWGGSNTEFGTPSLSSGGRYDPATDTWLPTSLTGAPTARSGHTAVWTGTEMLIWGGTGPLNTGGRYNPLTDTWSPISTSGAAPEARNEHTAIWTGDRMIVWGGNGASGYLASGARYDPATNTWQATASGGAPQARRAHTAVWTGSAMIVWGGIASNGTPFGDGAIYSPSTDTWSPMSSANAPTPRYRHSALWTGTRMLIWGSATSDSTGGRYDPSTDTWAATSTLGAPSGSGNHVAVWTGSQMLVWGGGAGAGGRYDPAADSWATLSTMNAPQNRSYAGAVWTGTRMIVWGGWSSIYLDLDTGGRYDPGTDTWTPTAIGSAPPPRAKHTAIWTGNHMIVWGGSDPSSVDLATGARYDPAVDAWRSTTSFQAPSARSGHVAVWTGSRMIVWGGSAGNTGGRYDPIADSWASISTTAAPPFYFGYTAVWTGTRMIVWGGPSAGGGRYDPSTDTWTSVSTVNAPPLTGHTAVWTGSKMIIWGGVNSTLNGSGGRYDPVTDSWLPTTLTGAPVSRQYHTAVWTGSRMLIWGGWNPNLACNQQFLGSGASYDPLADTWTSVASGGGTGSKATAVWTGSRMIVWGGYREDHAVTGCALVQSYSLAAGGIYDPSTNSWSVDSGNLPRSRYGHQAIWTGTSMLVWGGDHKETTGGPLRLRDGGTLVVGQNADNDGDGFSECNGDCNDANPAVHPGAPEICNGLDDNCDGTVDEGFDQDGDGHTTCAGDCNDADPAVWGYPPEEVDLNLDSSTPTNLSWLDLGQYIGPETVYDLVSGTMGPLGGIDTSVGACVQSGLTQAQYADSSSDPTPGTGDWYLVRARNSCGAGTYGSSSSGQTRVLPSCP